MASKAEKQHWAYQYGTDREYQKWCRKRPSAYSGKTDNIVYAHYRTAANSGIACKPPFSGIPLTAQEHYIQHQVGQYNFMTRERWEALVDMHLERWIASKGNEYGKSI